MSSELEQQLIALVNSGAFSEKEIKEMIDSSKPKKKRGRQPKEDKQVTKEKKSLGRPKEIERNTLILLQHSLMLSLLDGVPTARTMIRNVLTDTYHRDHSVIGKVLTNNKKTVGTLSRLSTDSTPFDKGFIDFRRTKFYLPLGVYHFFLQEIERLRKNICHQRISLNSQLVILKNTHKIISNLEMVFCVTVHQK